MITHEITSRSKYIWAVVMALLTLPAMAQTDIMRLDDAIRIALLNNYGIIIQKKNLEENQINNSWGQAGALPTISLNATDAEGWNNTIDDAFTSNRNASVQLDWVVFRGYSAKISKSRLNEMENLSDVNLKITTENTIVSVTMAYYSALLQLENLESSEKIMKLSKDLYDREQLKKDIGSSKSYNLLQAQNSWLQDRSTYLSARANYNNAVRQLNFLMAEPSEKTYVLEKGFTADTSSFDLDVLKEKLLSDNYSLRTQYINMEMARLDVRSAKGAFYPTISAGLNGGYNASETRFQSDLIPNQYSDGFSGGITAGISYTLFQGGTRKQALKIAQIEEEISSIETDQMKDELENQLAQEFELYEVRKELLALSQEQLKAAELNLTLSRQKFETGAINSFNFRDVQQIYIQATWNYHRAIYDVIESYNALLQLTGGVIGHYES